jgi:DNA-directed RNA polymerase specialized sigma24 family protein
MARTRPRPSQTRKNPLDLDPASIRICRKLASQFAQKYCLEYEETLDEALLWAVEARAIYDPSCGTQLSSWVYRIVWMELTNRCPRHFRQTMVDDAFATPVVDAVNDPERICDFRLRLARLSREARAVAQLLFNCPAEVISVIHSPRASRKALGELAEARLGLSGPSYTRALEELQTVLPE